MPVPVHVRARAKPPRAFATDHVHSPTVLSWNPDTISFLSLTFLAAIWALLHLALSLLAARTARLPVWLRATGWLPPLTPVAGFLSGGRVRAILWCIVGLTYLVIRTRV